MGDEPGANIGGHDVTDLARMPLEELVGLGDSPLACALRRRRREIDRPDITVAIHDSNAG